MAEEIYSNIREVLSELIGSRIIDITQQDEEEFKEDGHSTIYLHLDNGKTFYIDYPPDPDDECDVVFGMFE